ncbi:hypothetical protein LXA43DRAFT_1117167 [Ganoderma leucocontextum]|nr:hypothetical protein LXA43DRAFT_1117167 [Ganoderma leucocontextum]
MSTSSLVGSYVALQINAKAMVAEYADSPILALAKALGTQKYVALVEKEVQVASCSDEPMWRVYRVSFVGRHTRLRPGAPLPEERCLPIYPASPSCHATAHAPVRPSKPFPKHDCCHRPGIETFIRVHRQPHHTRPQWTLTDEQMSRVAVMRKKLDGGEDGADDTEDGSYVQPPRLFTPTSHITSTSVAETSVSELFDREKARTRHDTMDSVSVYSADTNTDSTSTSVVVLLESPSASKLAVSMTLECDADLEDIPLVDVSFDLSELVTIPDPADFLEERNVVAHLVRKAETRHRNTPTPSVLSANAHSTFDAESRRLSLSLSRVRSHQSQRTLVGSRATSPLSAPPLPPVPVPAPAPVGPAKLRKARSRASYRPLPADARSVRSKNGERDRDRSDEERQKEKERKRGDSFSFTILSIPGDADGVALVEERIPLVAWQWLAALADTPVRVMLKRPALAVRRWVLYVVRKGRRRRESGVKAKGTYCPEEDSELNQ